VRRHDIFRRRKTLRLDFREQVLQPGVIFAVVAQDRRLDLGRRSDDEPHFAAQGKGQIVHHLVVEGIHRQQFHRPAALGRKRQHAVVTGLFRG